MKLTKCTKYVMTIPDFVCRRRKGSHRRRHFRRVMSCASFSPDKSGRHFLSSVVPVVPRAPERVRSRLLCGRRPRRGRTRLSTRGRPPAAVAIGTFSNDKRGEMDRKTAKKREREQRTNHRESPSKRERACASLSQFCSLRSICPELIER